VAAAYALCISVPSVALTIANGSVAAHCLFEDANATAHVHARAAQTAPHFHSANSKHGHVDMAEPIKNWDDAQAAVSGCCGLFGAPAIVSNESVLDADRHPGSAAFPTLVVNLNGRGPERINRPPIDL